MPTPQIFRENQLLTTSFIFSIITRGKYIHLQRNSLTAEIINELWWLYFNSTYRGNVLSTVWPANVSPSSNRPLSSVHNKHSNWTAVHKTNKHQHAVSKCMFCSQFERFLNVKFTIHYESLYVMRTTALPPHCRSTKVNNYIIWHTNQWASSAHIYYARDRLGKLEIWE